MKNLANQSTHLKPNASDSAAQAPAERKIAEVTLIYVPIFIGGRHRGAGMGPAAVRVAELPEQIEKLGFKVVNEVDIPQPSTACWFDEKSVGSRCLPEIAQVSADLAVAVEAAMEAGTIPITIGGDHSLAIGSISGVSRYYKQKQEKFGLVWFDAHGDINTPDTSYSANLHGMPLAISLGKGDETLTQLGGFSPKVEGKRAVLIGLRDVDPPEKELIRELGIHAFTMRDIDHLGMGKLCELALSLIGTDINGIHLSFDIDVMDPEIAPGVTTVAPGGMSFREAHLALTILAETGLVRSIDFVELNPARDIRNRTAELAVDLIKTSLGHKIM
jgi:arginase